MYTCGSLFTGIGGIDLAFVRAGFTVKWQVEIEPFCRAVLAKHAPEYWPDAVVYEDVKYVGRDTLSPVDVIFGGVPCQPASHAGKRRGESDDRWLWGEALRVVSEVQPRYVLFENVSGLRTLNGGDSYREILRQLASIGYDVEWTHLRASDVGAPHRRERIFIVAYANVGRWRQELASNEDGIAERFGELAHASRNGETDQSGRIDGATLVSTIVGTGSGIIAGNTSTRVRLNERTSASGEADVVNTDIGRWGSRRAKLSKQRWTSASVESSSLVNSNGERQQEQCSDFAAISPFIGAERASMGHSQPSGLEGIAVSSLEAAGEFATDLSWQTQSILGRAIARLSRQLDGTRWPARPGQPQTHGKPRALHQVYLSVLQGSRHWATPLYRKLLSQSRRQSTKRSKQRIMYEVAKRLKLGLYGRKS